MEHWVQGPSRTFLLVTSKIKLCNLGSTILTSDFLLRLEEGMSVMRAYQKFLKSAKKKNNLTVAVQENY